MMGKCVKILKDSGRGRYYIFLIALIYPKACTEKLNNTVMLSVRQEQNYIMLLYVIITHSTLFSILCLCSPALIWPRNLAGEVNL